YVYGYISSAITWDNTVRLVGNVYISEEGLLTIEPGVTVYGHNAASRLIIQGQLHADGISESSPIRFTAAAAEPVPGSWGYIQFQNGSGGHIRHAIVEYAGSNDTTNTIHTAAIQI